MFALAIPALTALWVLTEYYEEHTWPTRIASEPHVAGTWDPWLFFVAGIWLIILVIHALRTYLGRAVGPIGAVHPLAHDAGGGWSRSRAAEAR